ncbi:hypothetical protein RUND412_006137 [Rhizina undulata]
MPSNANAIPPPEEITGHSALPLARVKKIIRLDDEVTGCSNNAAFLVTVAAEMFVQYLAQQGLKMTYADRKQRKTMQYKDLASAVSRIDNLEFLSDVIPPTVPYKQIRDRKLKAAREAEAGQLTLNGTRIVPITTPSASGSNGESGEKAAVRNGKRKEGANGKVNGNGNGVEKAVDTDRDDDTEMS